MSTKKISELTKVDSVQNTDLLIVETSDGTRAINKSDLVAVKVVSISLPTNNWSGEGTFTQSVIISEATANSKVDLQPDSVAIEQLINDGTSALYINNDNGAFTAYAIGEKPTVDLTLQATIVEVAL